MEAGNRVRKAIVAMAIAFGLAFAAPVRAADQSQPAAPFDEKQNKSIQQLIHQYILDHPEVIVEAMQKLQAQQQQAEDQRLRDAAKSVKPVAAEDHIRGDLGAPVKVIEFSDFECPFCKGFHATMKQVMADYEKDGKVAWVYRHFPIDELHSKARKEAQAAECAGELGGNTAFWAYADKLFEVTPSNNRLDPAQLPQIAEQVGLDRAKFDTCLDGDARGGKFAAHIEANVQDAAASGGQGTPYSLVITAKGEVVPINGAQPYEEVKAIIDSALKAQ
jgi:protein-disulfide isomerase